MTSAEARPESRIEVSGPVPREYAEILSAGALRFVETLVRAFEPRRRELLQHRTERQRDIDAGNLPDFLQETERVRRAEWRVAPIPRDLEDRRVEITGPPHRKVIVQALNSGASVFMADFEDANSPTWKNVIEGQINLRDAVRGTIEFTTPEGKRLVLRDGAAVLMVRPRGWHLVEKHVLFDGRPVSASLVDFGLFLFHNARRLVDAGTGPYFYIPKLEGHLEARLWNDVFILAQEELGLPRGTIRATVLIETILAAFEMDEILYELREHSGGLNCGRWDYVFSFIKRFRSKPEFVLPDRGQVTMNTHFMRSYSLLAIQTCHRRGIHAIGGMAAQIPIEDDPVANSDALEKIRADKVREASDGHDGTWVAHPRLVPVAKAIFDEKMKHLNQIHRKREDVRVTRDDLLAVPEGRITEDGLRRNLDVAIRYLGSWLGGTGCVPIYNLKEDAATSELSRAQVWQWIHHPAGVLEDGGKITADLCRRLIPEELARIRAALGEQRFVKERFELARDLIDDIVTRDDFVEFMTLVAYDHLA